MFHEVNCHNRASDVSHVGARLIPHLCKIALK